MNKTIGILAHVDSGKTTLSEQLLYLSGSTRSLGQVNQKTSHLDDDEIERERGLTVFSSQGEFHFQDNHYFLIDTPGHMDFSAAAERTLSVLDYAILLINGAEGVMAHTITLFRLLKAYHVPTFLFINKMDMAGADLDSCLRDIKMKLSGDVLLITSMDELEHPAVGMIEEICEKDEALLEDYFAGTLSTNRLMAGLTALIKQERILPCCIGSALQQASVLGFLRIFDFLTPTSYRKDQEFSGYIYKIIHEAGPHPIAFMKIHQGVLHIKDSFTLAPGQEPEKINEIRSYCGSKYARLEEARAGSIVAVTGLKDPVCGMTLGAASASSTSLLKPLLRTAVIHPKEFTALGVLSILRILEREEPSLKPAYDTETGQISISIMGPIQLEVLAYQIRQRFSLSVSFTQPRILYQETISAPVTGYGHYEPLRHYAEVNLLLTPACRGAGITYESRCHVDVLPANYQSQVRSHIFSRRHKGVLTGSPVDDIHIILIGGRAHMKHTSGGDFREAVYRAIRQGLEKADSLLLEPFYQFEIYVSAELSGRILSDITRMHGTFEPPLQKDGQVFIKGQGPVAAFMDYPREFLSLTKGFGTISLIPAGYFPCHNPDEVIREIGYDKGGDQEHTSCSVFCSHGTSFVVNWDEAEDHMHCIQDSAKILKDILSDRINK